MTTTLQPMLSGIPMTGHSPENLTVTADDVVNQIVSAVNYFVQYLIGLFNEEVPPDAPHYWFDVAAPYLMAAAALISCLCLCHCLFWCISAILLRCFNFVCSLNRCLCCAESSDSEELLMIAPGRSPLLMRRAVFEANPRGYFRDLRGQPNDFYYSV